VLCARWLEQFFCSELSFCHELPFDRSSLTHSASGAEEQLVALILESLSVAHKFGVVFTRDPGRVVVDTTVQPKAVARCLCPRRCNLPPL
jgi:IS5 family transposase